MFVWLLTSCVVTALTIGDTVVYFDPYDFDCEWHFSLKVQLCWMIVQGLYILLPIAVIIITNIWIVFIATKHARNRTCLPSKAAVITVSCICWIFIGSYIPFFIRIVVNVPQLFNPIVSINYIANPIVYTITNYRFRCFIKKMIHLN